LGALLLAFWRRSGDRQNRAHRAAIIVAGIFLAWKEGFVRPDVHVVVFLIYAFFSIALLPAFLAC